jgi:hypothetical protein
MQITVKASEKHRIFYHPYGPEHCLQTKAAWMQICVMRSRDRITQIENNSNSTQLFIYCQRLFLKLIEFNSLIITLSYVSIRTFALLN